MSTRHNLIWIPMCKFPHWGILSSFPHTVCDTWMKQETANRRGNKYATKQMSGPFPLHHWTWFKLKTDLESTPSQFSSCSAPPSAIHFPFLLHSPFPQTCNLKTNGKSRSNGRITNNKWWRDIAAYIKTTSWKHSFPVEELQTSLSSGNCPFKWSHILTMPASETDVLLLSILRLGTAEQW